MVRWVPIVPFRASILCSANNYSSTCLTFRLGFGDISTLSWCFVMIFGEFLDADCLVIVHFTSFTRRSIRIIAILPFLAFPSSSLMRYIWKSTYLWLQGVLKSLISIFPSQWSIWGLAKRTCWFNTTARLATHSLAKRSATSSPIRCMKSPLKVKPQSSIVRSRSCRIRPSISRANWVCYWQK